MALHYFMVEAARRVRLPYAGRGAYTIDYKRIEVPFGKGQEFKTGKQASAHATSLARDLMPQASEVSVAKMHGGCGTVEYLKRSEEHFDTRW